VSVAQPAVGTADLVDHMATLAEEARQAGAPSAKRVLLLAAAHALPVLPQRLHGPFAAYPARPIAARAETSRARRRYTGRDGTWEGRGG
jgi:hypothetical protein